MGVMKVRCFFYFVLAFVGGIGFAGSLDARTYEIDLDHSSVGFKIRHLLSHVQGRFKDFKGTFEIDDKTGALVSIKASIQAISIDTNVEKRDNHLRSPDFFDVQKFPTLEFVSDPFSLAQGQSGKIPGRLTLHGVTKPVVWDAEFAGEAQDPWGNKKAAFSLTMKRLNRKDYGLSWNKALETGGLLVGEEVDIDVGVEGDLQKRANPAASIEDTTKVTNKKK